MGRSVYAIRSEAGPIKIGISKSPAVRLAELVNQQPFDAKIIHTLHTDDDVARAIESAAHQLLSAKRRRGEWFDVSEEEAIAAITEAAASLGAAQTQEADDPMVRHNMVVSKAWLRRLDEWRAQQRPIPSRSEAARMIIEQVLCVSP